jgi:hypothetical protein
MQMVYVLQISDDIDKPVAYATELLAKDRAALAARDRASRLTRGLTPRTAASCGLSRSAGYSRSTAVPYVSPDRGSPHGRAPRRTEDTRVLGPWPPRLTDS